MATKNTKKASVKLMRVLYILLTLLMIVGGYLAYQVLALDGLANNKLNAISSIFNKADKAEKEELTALGEFTLKLSDGHYAKLSINTGFVGKVEELSEHMPILRDKIIFELMKLDSTHMNVEQIDGTKKLLIKELNSLLPKTEIKNIYMDNLVVQ